MTEHLDVAELTPDDHLRTLAALAKDFERFATEFDKRRGAATAVTVGWRRRAAAIRWALDQNAYGVAASEVTT